MSRLKCPRIQAHIILVNYLRVDLLTGAVTVISVGGVEYPDREVPCRARSRASC